MQTKSWILLTKSSLDSQNYLRPLCGALTMAANGPIVKLEIEELAIDDSDLICPAAVSKVVFKRALHIAQNFRTYEGKLTGALLILSAPGLKSRPLEADSHLLLGQNIEDHGMEGPLRKAFSQDGGILIDGAWRDLDWTLPILPWTIRICIIRSWHQTWGGIGPCRAERPMHSVDCTVYWWICYSVLTLSSKPREAKVL